MKKTRDSLDEYTIVLAGLLHDIGKVLVRSGVRGSRHEKLSADFIEGYKELFESIGINSEKLARLVLCHHSERLTQRERTEKCDSIKDLVDALKNGDRASAPERFSARERKGYSTGGSASTRLLVSPLWIKYFGEKRDLKSIKEPSEILLKSKICYEPVPLTLISRYGGNPEVAMRTYRTINCNSYSSEASEKELRKWYKKILGELEKAFDLLQSMAKSRLLTVDSLVYTLTNYLRYTLLLIPDDIYWSSIPDTSLALHSILTAALSYALHNGNGRIRLGILDISGIQKYISSIISLKGALKQLRGRSLLLQLTMRAASEYLAERLGIPSTNIILLRGDSALFILPDRDGIEAEFEEALRDINEEVYSIFHGDVYLAGAMSSPFKPDYTLPWDKDHLRKGFSKALVELGRKLSVDKYRRLGRIASIVAKEQDEVLSGSVTPMICDLCGKTLPGSRVINIRERENSRIVEYYFKTIKDEIKHICRACYLAHMAGDAAVNLEFVVEIISNRIAETLQGILLGDTRGSGSIEIPAPPHGFKYSIIPFPKMRRTYILISIKPGQRINSPDEAWADLKKFLVKFLLVNIIGKKLYSGLDSIRINILRVNDPSSMLPRQCEGLVEEPVKGVRISYGFGNIFLNFTNKTTEELDKLAEKEEGEQSFLAWVKTDIDHMGRTGLYLAGSIGRYTTMAELVNFFTNMIGYRTLDFNAEHPGNKKEEIADHAMIVFSGGDDTFLIARFPEALYYIDHYSSWFREFFGTIRDEEGEKQLLTLSAGLYLSEPDYPAYISYRNALEKLRTAKDEGRNLIDLSFLELNVKNNVSRYNGPVRSIDWKTYSILLHKSIDPGLLNWITINRVLSFNIMILLRKIAETTYVSQTMNPDLYRNLAEHIIVFSYIYERAASIGKTSLFDKVAKEISILLGIVPPIPEQYIDLLAGSRINEIYRSAATFYRLLQLALLRTRELL